MSQNALLTFCLADRPGSYLAVLGRLSGMEISGSSPFQCVPSFLRFRHSYLGGSRSLLQASASLDTPKSLPRYEQTVRSVFIRGGKEAKSDLFDLLKSEESPLGSSGAQCTSWRFLREMRKLDSEHQCPVIPRCPFTSGKTWLRSALVKIGDVRSTVNHAPEEELPLREYGFIPPSSHFDMDIPVGEFEGFGEIEVRVNTADKVGVLCRTVGDLLGVSTEFSPHEPGSAVFNVSSVSSDKCDNSLFSFESFYGQVLQKGEAQMSFSRSYPEVVMCAPASEDSMENWVEYMTQLVDFHNRSYGMQDMGDRFRLFRSVDYLDVPPLPGHRDSYKMELKPVLVALRADSSSFSGFEGRIAQMMSETEIESGEPLDSIEQTLLGFCANLVADYRKTSQQFPGLTLTRPFEAIR